MAIDKIAILIKIASLAFEKIANPMMVERGLTIAQYRVLKFLYSQKSASSRVVDIEKECAITHPTVLGLLDGLEKKGFVVKEVNPRDARSKVISLTPKARAQQAELEEVGNQIEEKLTAPLTAAEKKQLVHLLRKLLGMSEGK